MDIVGTGGDGTHSFNTSTTVALVLAAAGIPVAKHSNQAASSSCGTADCLEALGININLTPEQAQNMARQADGVIIGSAIVKLVAQYGQAAAATVADYVRAVSKRQ
jgi:thymidine phosphorylase